jgi:hypothetical protein
VKLGKNASGTCAMLSEICGGEVMKKLSVSEWHKRFQEGRENVEDERSVQHLTDPMKTLKKGGIWCIQTDF